MGEFGHKTAVYNEFFILNRNNIIAYSSILSALHARQRAWSCGVQLRAPLTENGSGDLLV
jgi:hypothetical protein